MTHLDASKTANGIARANRDLSGFSEKPIRFIADDCLTFLDKEIKRFCLDKDASLGPIDTPTAAAAAASSSGSKSSSWDDSDGYDGLIFDPPAFGRGGDKRQWKLDSDMPKLFERIPCLLSADPVFVLVTCHDPAWTPDLLADSLGSALRGYGGRLDKGELKLNPAEEYKGRGLSLGCYARWSSSTKR